MVISGQFTKIIYRGSNGYTVAVFELADSVDEEITVTGYLPAIDSDHTYRLEGDYVDHPRYGMQFNIETIERERMTDTENLIRYFSGPTFKGIGPKFARVMVEALGEHILDILQNDRDALLTIPGMTERRRQSIEAGLLMDQDEKYFYLTANHLSMKHIVKLENTYGPEMLEIVKENPYKMMFDIDGIGFQTADRFAQSIGFALDHPYRLEALAENILLDECIRRGDSYLEEETFKNEFIKKADCDNYDLDEIIAALIKDSRAVLEEGRLYHHTQYKAERYIAGYLAQFPLEPFRQVDREEIDAGIQEIQAEFGIEYQDKQKEAIEAFFENDLLILTGGPGTGKTTVVRGMVELCRRIFPYYSIVLCAPTGRASKRLSELTDCDSKTIHSLLLWDKDSGRFSKDENDPLNIDLLIIDEFSMVDQWLFYSLLKAGASIRKMIIIGDRDQLPSVGIGCVLKDLIECDLFKVVELEKIYRQKEGSDIISLARDIRMDECESICTDNDIRFFECDQDQIKPLTLQVVEHALKRYETLEEGFMNVQVLAPRYKGINGIDRLNAILQEQFNPPSPSKKQLRIGPRIFRENDKILQLKNQPDDDVFNGDIGILKEIVTAKEAHDDEDHLIVDYDGIMVEYMSDTFANITHAYCVSVHKAQGSEYPIVILPMDTQYGIMLQKRLIYTAVSRANSSLIMIGQKEAFFAGIHRQEFYERQTTLKDRLVDEFQAFEQ